LFYVSRGVFCLVDKDTSLIGRKKLKEVTEAGLFMYQFRQIIAVAIAALCSMRKSIRTKQSNGFTPLDKATDFYPVRKNDNIELSKGINR